MRRLFNPRIFLGLGLLAGPAGAQQEAPGRLQGTVIDEASGQPVAVARITVEGTALAATTDLRGRYLIDGLPVGLYTVAVRAIGYAPKTILGLEIRPGQRVTLDVSMSTASIELAAIEVEATVERSSTAGLLEQRRNASVVVDAVGREQLARTPDGDAAEAVKRVTGMSVVGDRYVYIRGLGNRYAGATLNGAPLPSPEPDRKTVAFDLFPASLLESIVTSKTYSPDRPGDYTGGMVDIRTRDLPPGRSWRVSLGTSANTNATFASGLGYPGGGLDFLGFDDGTRALPDDVPANVKVVNSELPEAEIERIGQAFAPVWEPRARTVPINQSGSLAWADRLGVFGLPVGLALTGTYSSSFTNAELIERVIVRADQAEEPETDYAGSLTERTVRWGGLATLSVLLSPTQQLTIRSLYSRSAEDQARVLEGFNRDRNNDLRNFRLRFTGREMWSSSLAGEHLLTGLGNTRVTWRAGYASAALDEPDRREVVYDRAPNGDFAWRELTNSGLRYFTALNDRDVSGALDLTVPLGGGTGFSAVKVGGLLLDKDRDFFTRRFRFRARRDVGDAVFLSPDSLFSDAFIGPDGLQIQEDTRRTDNYDATQTTRAGYAMLDLELTQALRVSTGARIEQVRQEVQPLDLFPLGLPPLDGALLDDTDVLPALNLTVSLSPLVKLRAAASATVARPEFRELAPFDFVDYAGGFLQVGNPNLTRTRIRNYDLRWEWFPRPGEVLAVSGFYKSFDDPIEAIVFPSSELIATFSNAASAELVGAEFELRTNLGTFLEALRHVTVSSNVTLVHSTVRSSDSLDLPGGGRIAIAPRDRALQGQSPYVVNGALSWFQPSAGLTATILYNRFGRRIDKVGTQVLPDVFEEPRDQLDLVLQQALSPGTSLKLTATNLLDETAEFRQAGQLVSRATRGRAFSIAFSFGSAR